MFRLILSKLIRKMNNIDIPDKCEAYRYIPESLNDICDCKNECKYNGGGDMTVNLSSFQPFKNQHAGASPLAGGNSPRFEPNLKRGSYKGLRPCS